MMSTPSKLVMYGYHRVIEMVKINYDTITIQMENLKWLLPSTTLHPFKT